MRVLLRLMALLAGLLLAGLPAPAQADPVTRLAPPSAPQPAASWITPTRLLWSVADVDDDVFVPIPSAPFTQTAGRQAPRERAASHAVLPWLMAAPQPLPARIAAAALPLTSTDRHPADGRGPPVPSSRVSSR